MLDNGFQYFLASSYFSDILDKWDWVCLYSGWDVLPFRPELTQCRLLFPSHFSSKTYLVVKFCYKLNDYLIDCSELLVSMGNRLQQDCNIHFTFLNRTHVKIPNIFHVKWIQYAFSTSGVLYPVCSHLCDVWSSSHFGIIFLLIFSNLICVIHLEFK